MCSFYKLISSKCIYLEKLQVVYKFNIFSVDLSSKEESVHSVCACAGLKTMHYHICEDFSKIII